MTFAAALSQPTFWPQQLPSAQPCLATRVATCHNQFTALHTTLRSACSNVPAAHCLIPCTAGKHATAVTYMNRSYLSASMFAPTACMIVAVQAL
jgi:hypothetical protein